MDIKVREPKQVKYNDWTLLGKEFRIGIIWHGVFECECGNIDIRRVKDIKKHGTSCFGCCWRKRKIENGIITRESIIGNYGKFKELGQEFRIENRWYKAT